jgi:hypothetical protein
MVKQQNPWRQSESEPYRPRYCCLSAKLVPTFVGRGCRVVSATNPHRRFLGILQQSLYYFFQVVPQCTHEAEWTPFQTHYFSENLVALGIEPETSEYVARNSDH